MSITVADVISEVLVNLRLSNDSDTKTKFKTTENINNAQRQIALDFPPSSIETLILTANVNLTLGTNHYSWPVATFYRLVGIRIDYFNTISNTNPGKEALA